MPLFYIAYIDLHMNMNSIDTLSFGLILYCVPLNQHFGLWMLWIKVKPLICDRRSPLGGRYNLTLTTDLDIWNFEWISLSS